MLKSYVMSKVLTFIGAHLNEGFNESDNFTLISLEDILKRLKQPSPLVALILRVDVQRRIFFVLSFPARNQKESSGSSSVVYEPQNIQQFLSSKGNIQNWDESLFKLFSEILSSDGVNNDYIDSKNRKMLLFRHIEAQKIIGFGIGLKNS